jgi:hypothetical protein
MERGRPTAILARPPAAVALGAYLAAAGLMFGLPMIEHGGRIIGYGSDPQIFVWALAWWPHALLHGLDPINTRAIYYPEGLDLAHGAMVPAAAILLWPVTAILGPIGSYNAGMVLSPALAAFFAFLLCRRLTGSPWAALAGGWLFGFSPYLLGQMAGHLHMTLVFMVPAIVHLGLRAYAGELARRRAIALLALALTVQFYIAAEVFVSLTVFGAVALVAAWLLAAPEDRVRLRELVIVLVGAYAGATVLCAPYLAEAFRPGAVPAVLNRSELVTDDLLGYLLPSRWTLIGGTTFAGRTARFTASPVESSAYLTLPLLAMAALGARGARRSLGVRVALVTLAIAVVCSFGGHLYVDGTKTIPLPWWLAERLPVLGQLLPARFSDYAFLIVAVLAALWLSRARSRLLAGGLAALAVAGAWPALGNGPWDSATAIPPLLATQAYRRVLGAHEVALVVPNGNAGPSMLWQAVTGFRFSLAGGYALPPEAPTPYSNDPLTPALNSVPVPQDGPLTRYFLAQHGVTVVLAPVGAPTTAPWEALLERIGWHAAVHGGVLVMRRG